MHRSPADPEPRGLPRSLSRVLGFSALVLALLANPWLLGLIIAPDRRIETTSVRAVILVGEALLLILGLVLLSNRHRITTRDVALTAGSAIFALAGGVLLLQFFYHMSPIRSGWRSNANRLEENELGFRGHSIHYSPDDFVIVLLGDSNVQANACAYDWMPECRLEEHLKRMGRVVKVFTIGANGYGQDQELMAIEEYFGRYRADSSSCSGSILAMMSGTMSFPRAAPVRGRNPPFGWKAIACGALRKPGKSPSGLTGSRPWLSWSDFGCPAVGMRIGCVGSRRHTNPWRSTKARSTIG